MATSELTSRPPPPPDSDATLAAASERTVQEGRRAADRLIGLASTVGISADPAISRTTAGTEGLVTPECPDRYDSMSPSSEIGRGGIGRVLIVHDRHIGRDIALKELLGTAAGGANPTGVTDDTAPEVRRFVREARVTGQLEHPNIVPVYELGRRQDGTLYYTMKLVRGRTLTDALEEAKTLEQRLKLLSHYTDLCHAIAYAHSRGVIHRDIKTDNVMVGEFGETVVLDWGLAKVRGTKDMLPATASLDDSLHVREDLTIAGSLMGTPSYMSPEQAAGDIEHVDERSDVWSLGVVLFELLTGEVPFSGRGVKELTSRIMTETPRAPRAIDPRVPAELSSVCIKALARDPAARYPSARELAAEIESFQSGTRVSAHEYSSWELLTRLASKNKAALVASGAVLAAIVSALVVTSSFYAREKSARVIAQQATQREQLARQQERLERTLADYHIAQGVQEKSLRAASESSWPAVRILSAAALLHNPASPRSPFSDPLFASSHPEADRLYLTSLSYVFQAQANAALSLQRVIVDDQKLLCVALSPDGRRLAAGGEGKALRLWDLRTGSLIATLSGHAAIVSSAAFSPDGNRIVSAAQDGEVRVWDAHESTLVGAFSAHAEPVEDVSFSNDGSLFATVSRDGTAALWDAATLKKTGTLVGHGGSVHSIDLSASRVLTGSRDHSARIWDLASGRTVQRLEGHKAVVHGVAFSPDGALAATASYDRSIRVWHAATGEMAWSSEGIEDEVLSVAFSPDGKLVASAAWDRTVRLWDARTGMLLTRLEAHDAAVWDLAFTPDGGTLVSVGDDKRIRLWNVRPTAPVWSAPGQGYVWAARYSPDGRRVVTAGADSIVRIWDRASAQPLHVLRGHRDLVYDATFSSDGRLIASGGYDHTARVWDASSGALLQTLSGHDNGVRSVAFSPDGRQLVTGSQDHSLAIWDVRSGELSRKLVGHGGAVRGVAWSGNGKLIASGANDRTVRLWDAATGAERRVLEGSTDTFVGVAFSSDSRLLAAGGFDGSTMLWRADTGELQQRLASHQGPVFSVRFSPDDRYLLSASDDRTVGLWVVGESRPALLIGATQSVVTADFAPDGRSMILGDAWAVRQYPVDLKIRDVDPAQLLADAQKAAGLTLDGFSLKTSN